MGGRTMVASGPSPRTWGEHLLRSNVIGPSRTIPTHVGRTYSSHHPTCWLADHPHARGENSVVLISSPASFGPSPRTWGERSDWHDLQVSPRTIPTHVGRTAWAENVESSRSGPSPRTWGEQHLLVEDRCRSADHPHARGENFGSNQTADDRGGPSPRTWGEPRYRQPCRSLLGPSPRTWGEHPSAITWPATVTDHPHARGENSSVALNLVSHRADHPHARGENPPVHDTPHRVTGPSPRTWGEHRTVRARER